MSLTLTLLEDIETLNPWFKNSSISTPEILKTYVNRSQQSHLLDPEWDSFWTVLIGPRRAGKTTLANYLCKQLLSSKRFKELLYLNCDYDAIRQQFSSPSLIVQL